MPYKRHPFAKVDGRELQQCQDCGLLRESNKIGAAADHNPDRWRYRDPETMEIVPFKAKCPGRRNKIK